ncbi:MAG: glycosyl transferase, partial [Candidatus Sabulitectum sp.]|nr:glycosyl transferase [Candidatus Sabulitectum sp.]
TLISYSRICLLLSDLHNFDNYISHAGSLKHILNGNTWDGQWYLRGFYDDGTPLGSSANDECRIDSIAQSWAVLSGAGESERTEIAMNSVLEHLVDFNNNLLLLLSPPFDRSDHDPGYIMGYPPGIRENGGQYTHAAAWVAWAFAKQGRGDIAESLFRLLNPIYHSDSPRKRDIYRVEPYVAAADVYSAEEHRGRGGWTWYTGSSGWLYRLGIEAILGITTSGSNLIISPCIPAGWTGFSAVIKRGDTSFRITVSNPDGVSTGVLSVTLDGIQLRSGLVPLDIDGSDHTITVIMGTTL